MWCIIYTLFFVFYVICMYIFRKTESWYQFKTIFVLNDHTYMTGNFLIEAAGPPRRNRVSTCLDLLCDTIWITLCSCHIFGVLLSVV